MAAIFKLRRGTSASPALTDGELFLNYSLGALQYASGSTVFTLLPIDKSISGDIILTGDITASNMVLSGDISARNVTLSGNIIIGDEIQDNIVVQGQFSGSLIPSASAEYDLGTQTKKWRNLYSVSASFDNILVPGSGILSSSNTDFSDYTSSVENRLTNIEITTQSLDFRLDVEETKSLTLETVTSSIDNRLDNLELDSASQDNRLINLELTSASHDDRLTQLETDTGSQDNRLDNLELTSASHDDRLDQLEVDSGSQDNRLTNLEITSASHDDRLDQLESDSGSQDDRLTNLELTSASHDDRLGQLEVDSGSQDNRLINLELTSASHDDRLDQLESDSGSQDNRLDNLELTSASHDDRLTQIESATSSLDSRLDTEEEKSLTLEIVTSSLDDRISQLEVDSGSQDNRLDNLELTSASHESRLDLLSDVSHSHSNKSYLDVINQNLSNISDVTFNSITASGDVLISGDLTVLGAATEISTTELSIEDKLITLASGSTNSAEADGAGIEIAGANKSITWDDPSQSFIINSLVSSSVGFKGDGSQLINIQHENIDFGGSNIVSGSSQVTQSLDLRYLEINGDDVVSGSSQIIYGGISQIPNNIVSASNDTANIHFTITDGVISAITTGGILSGSAQVTQSLDLRYLEINGDDVVSGSDQVTASLDLRYELQGSGIVSGSSQVTSSLDLRYLEINGDDVVSGSAQLTSSLDLRYLEINGDDVVSGSSQIIYGEVSQIPNNIVSSSTDSSTVTFTITDGDITANLIGGVISGSDQVIEQLPDGLVSGSSQVTQSLDLRYLEINGDSVVSSSLFESNHQGVLTASINSTDTNVDLGLKESDSPTFSGLSLSSLSELGNGELNALVSGSAGSIGYRILGTAAFLNVSNSIDNDPNVIPTNFAVNQALIDAGAGDITSVNSSNLYSADNTGLVHNGGGTADGNGYFGNVGDIVLNLATGSVHFLDGVKKKLDVDNVFSSSQQLYDILDGRYSNELGDGVVSGSSQVTQSLDLRYLQINGDGVISGSSQVQIDDVTGFTSFSSSVDSRIDNLEASNVGDRLNQLEAETGSISNEQDVQDSRLSQLEAETGSISDEQSIQDDRLNQLSFETASISDEQAIQDDRLSQIEAVTASLDGLYEEKSSATHTLVSGSSQIVYGDISSLPTNIVSESTDSTNIDFTITNGNITANLKGGVVSGSNQLTGSFVTLDTDQTISGTKTFNDIIVNGTGSFAYIESIGGTAKIIGDSFVVVNTATPTSRYAGLSVYDSGSTLSTASFYFDSETNDWGYEYSSSAGIDYAVSIFGPEYSTKGNPTYLTSNTIPKAVDNHHLNDSNITDNGTTITLGSAVDVSGITNFNDTTQSTSKTTGAVIIDGGVGIAKTLNVGEDVIAYASSDRRLKDEITQIENPLQKINSIGGYSFVWNENQHIYKGKDYGVIAQEIEEILPELVETRENGYKAVKYDRIVSLLIEGIKELSKEVSELKEKIRNT